LLAVVAIPAILLPRDATGDVTAEKVRTAIDRGVDYLKRQQRGRAKGGDGAWEENPLYPGGLSALAMLALLESGIKPDDPVIDEGLRFLRTIKPSKTYVVGLQTMVYCLARPREDMHRIQENVKWLEDAQIKSGATAGMWDYGAGGLRRGDNSNTQFALLGLREAAEIGVAVDPEVWRRSRRHFETTQSGDGSWGYERGGGSGSMTVAGISSLIICGLRLHEGQEKIVAGRIENCGQWQQNDAVVRALDWLAKNFPIQRDRQSRLGFTGSGGWNFYYMYGLERAARLTGQRFIGQHDWYRLGAELLTDDPTRQPMAQKLGGVWEGIGIEQNKIVTTSFAVLFLSKGRSPVLINKLRHDAADPAKTEDWNNDRNDVRNITEHVSRHWERRMTWQVVDAKVAREQDVLKRVEDLLQAPVVFLSGHEAPAFNELEKQVLKSYVEQGGFIFAEACCSRPEFDAGIRQLLRELFPEQPLKVLAPDHAIWTADYRLEADGTLEGIGFG
jgi:hypothetical protein